MRIRLALSCLLVSLSASLAEERKPTVVKIEQTAPGEYQLVKDGQPFVIKGAGINFGAVQNIPKLKEMGGNSIRTWALSQLKEKLDGKDFLQLAEELDLAVCLGLWVQQPRMGHNYDDPKFIQKQRDAVRAWVRQYKDHPNLLVWGLGNEVEIGRKDEDYPKIFRELNELAKIVKEEDPNHPIVTTVAGLKPSKLKAIQENYPELDILGVNVYGSGPTVPEKLRESNWTKPYIMTEYGPRGPWEAPTTSWNAPREQTPEQKAALYAKTYDATVVADGKKCLGSYAFVWGHRQEGTSTWFGMFLPTGEKTETIDIVSNRWTGQWPSNRSPSIKDIAFAPTEKSVRPGMVVPIKVIATDQENDPVALEVTVMKESVKGAVGEKDKVPAVMADCIRKDGENFVLTAPKEPGAYRLFVKATDGQGGGASQSIAFLVE